MTDQTSSRISQQFGNYRLTRLLGVGGFAEVYLAQHVYLDTQAAIKVLRTQLASPDDQQSFLNEARIIAQLLHPHIIRVLDFGMQGEAPYLVMDFAPNGSLRERYPRGSLLPLPAVNSYVRQIASALQYAHYRRLVHRDIKPENMLIGRNNEILLSDFGISMIAQTTHLQRTQDVVGTIPYMAPEQIQGKPRPATDQYALGIIAYEWLSGERPFGGNSTEIYGQHLFSPPPSLCEKNPTIPPSIEQVIMTALAKDPQQRFPSIEDFASAFERATLDPSLPIHDFIPAAKSRPSAYAQTTVASPPSSSASYAQVTMANGTGISISNETRTRLDPPHDSPRVSRRTALIAGATGIVAIAGGGTWYWLSHRSRPLPPQGTIITRYNNHSDTIYTLSWHDDKIASAGNDGTVQIWDSFTGKTILTYHGYITDSSSGSPNTIRVTALAWSPDGNHIASAGNDYKVRIWDPGSGNISYIFTKHKYYDIGNGITALAWSYDSQYIASGADNDNGQMFVWSPSDGSIHTTNDGHSVNASENGRVDTLAWSHDNSRIACIGSNGILLFSSSTGKIDFDYTKQNSAIALDWLPDNQSIVSATSSDIQVWNVNAGAQRFDSDTSGLYSMALSPDGKYIGSGHDDGTVIIRDANTGKQLHSYHNLNLKSSIYTIAWAADSRRLAAAGEDKSVVIWVAV